MFCILKEAPHPFAAAPLASPPANQATQPSGYPPRCTIFFALYPGATRPPVSLDCYAFLSSDRLLATLLKALNGVGTLSTPIHYPETPFWRAPFSSTLSSPVFDLALPNGRRELPPYGMRVSQRLSPPVHCAPLKDRLETAWALRS